MKRPHTQGRVVAALAATGLLTLAAVGCGSSDDSSMNSTSRGGGGEEATKVAFVMPNAQEYFVQVANGAKQYAKDNPGIDLDVQFGAAYDDTQSQIAKIQNALTKEPQALVFTPSAKSVFVPVLKEAQSDGVPVVLVDTPEPGIDPTAFVGTNNEAGGGVAGKYVVDNFESGDQVGIITARPGQLATDARVAGFKKALEGSGIEVVGEVRGDCEAAPGRKAMENMLTAHPDMKAVFSPCDGSALGAIKAIGAAGARTQIISFDASPSALDEVAKGNIVAEVAQHPEKMGAEGVRVAVAAAKGEPVEDVDTGVELITRENVDVYKDRTLAEKIE